MDFTRKFIIVIASLIVIGAYLYGTGLVGIASACMVDGDCSGVKECITGICQSPPVVNPGFSATPDKGDAPLHVQFIDITSYQPGVTPTTFSWMYKNLSGVWVNMGTGQNPVHTFDQGVYDIQFTVTYDYPGNPPHTRFATKEQQNAITVPNTAPIACSQAVITIANMSISIKMNATDANGDALTFSIWKSPSYGSLGTINGSTVVYTPNMGFVGGDSFQFKASDGDKYDTATVTIAVNLPTCTCRPDQICVLGDCRCKDGYHEESGACVPNQCSNCRADQVCEMGVCVCPAGQKEQGGQCVVESGTQCGGGQIQLNLNICDDFNINGECINALPNADGVISINVTFVTEIKDEDGNIISSATTTQLVGVYEKSQQDTPFCIDAIYGPPQEEKRYGFCIPFLDWCFYPTTKTTYYMIYYDAWPDGYCPQDCGGHTLKSGGDFAEPHKFADNGRTCQCKPHIPWVTEGRGCGMYHTKYCIRIQ